ncbi:MAG: glycoside hydrolase family 3 N-terminal domain-containing protein, partial [Rubrobacteraceae bacterium]
TESLQELSLATEPSIPLFIAVDQEGGDISSAPWVSPQPAAADLGTRADPREVREVSKQIGSELLQAGVNTDFAPVVDTGFGAAIGNRSFGEDPGLVSRLGAASVKGFEEAGVVSSAKHFPNHGVAVTDSHTGLPVVDHDRQTIDSYDLPPFRAAVEAGVPMVMVGHLVYPAIDPELPASLSPEAIGLLREDLGFDGVVVTDDLAMAGASGEAPPSEAAVAAAKAGADLFVISSPPQQQADAYEAVVRAVENGEIPKGQIEESFRRIEKVKKEYPLYGKHRLE